MSINLQNNPREHLTLSTVVFSAIWHCDAHVANADRHQLIDILSIRNIMCWRYRQPKRKPLRTKKTIIKTTIYTRSCIVKGNPLERETFNTNQHIILV